MQHDRLTEISTRVRDAVSALLPGHQDKGRGRPGSAIGFTGGQHRTNAVAEFQIKALAEGGWWVSTPPRELERRRQITAPERE